MENLVPIGRFSRMCRMSIKALRHYDEIGLLRPAVVDPHSGYRYYTYAQANRAEAIRVLRSLDMPLNEIRDALAASASDTAAVLDRHRARLEAELDRHRRMIAFLRRLIDRKEGVMPYDVQIKSVPPQYVATVRFRGARRTLGQQISAGFGRIAGAAETAGVALAGPPFLVMLEFGDPGIDPGEDAEWDMLVGFPVAGPFASDGGVSVEESPAMTVASTVHRGPYDEVGPAYHTLYGWVQEHGHEVAGPIREVYLTDPSTVDSEADLVTEIQLPVSG